MQQNPLDLLKTYWGFTSFRATQEPVIEAAISKRDILALLPTGGGKSICFQVPGLTLGGLTIVISPLIALMEDQVNSLKSKGIKACAVTSALGFREIDIRLNNAAMGAYEFLYVSPERIQSPVFKERFKQMPVSLIVVDEAHCISEWGHDFRPSYLNIQALRELRPQIPCLALTATATLTVKEDIITSLGLMDPFVHEVSFFRSNLSYELIQTPNKMGSILAYCNGKEHMTGIVYCSTRKSVKELAKVFMANKLNASIYHGGMLPEERNQSLRQWMIGESPVMIATNAFGMGIDKPNVRFVLHYDFPESIEAYVQEAGRGGRDGNQARSIVFLDGTEKATLQEKFELKFPDITLISMAYERLLNSLRIAIGSGKNETYPVDINSLSEITSLSYLQLYNILKILELNQELYFDESTFHPPKVRLLVHGLDLYNFQIKYPQTHPIIQLIEQITDQDEARSVVLSPNKMAEALKMTLVKFEELLIFLDQNGIIEYTEAIHLPTITLLNERRPDGYMKLSYESFTQRKEKARIKLESVVHFLETNQCRTQQILHYFGQEATACGTCDICIKGTIPMEEIEQFILDALAIPIGYLELIERIPIAQDQLKHVLRDMQLTQKIQLIDGKFYR